MNRAIDIEISMNHNRSRATSLYCRRGSGGTGVGSPRRGHGGAAPRRSPFQPPASIRQGHGGAAPQTRSASTSVIEKACDTIILAPPDPIAGGGLGEPVWVPSGGGTGAQRPEKDYSSYHPSLSERAGEPASVPPRRGHGGAAPRRRPFQPPPSIVRGRHAGTTHKSHNVSERLLHPAEIERAADQQHQRR
jgi:hypothetical protein